MREIVNSITEIVGNTPLVRLGGINTTDADILAKLEFLNPGGSTKDRPLVRMLEDAERSGDLVPGSTIIDSSSGNFAAAMAMAGAARGYRVVCVVDPKLTKNIERMLKALGAELLFATRRDKTGSYLRHRLELRAEFVASTPKAWCPDQYKNPGVIASHYDGTGQEIAESIHALDGRLDYLVVAAGTGGTITGCSRKIKAEFPNAKILAVDAYGSKIFDDSVSPWLQKGLGSGLPAEELANVDLDLIDEVRLVEDRDAFLAARTMTASDGILAGGSSGTAIFGALTLAKESPPGTRIVTILPDRLERYLDEHVSDSWMEEHGFDTAFGAKALEERLDVWLATSETVIRQPGDLKVRRPVVKDTRFEHRMEEIDLGNSLAE